MVSSDGALKILNSCSLGRLTANFDHPISPKLAWFRSWHYWQNWRAIWVLQSCQLELELVRHGLQTTGSQSHVDETKNQLHDLENFRGRNNIGFLACGAILDMLCTFSWVITFTTFVLYKILYNFVKVVVPCKISGLDFLNSQTKVL
jgi:hypothetical protein